jgi:NNP family nitrate/nitrite transporter-like MFS transporter
VLSGLLLKGVGDVQRCFTILGACVVVSSICAIAVRFTAAHKAAEQELYLRALGREPVAAE